MRRSAAAGLFSLLIPAAAGAQSATTIPATGGNITITPIQHASVRLEHAGKIIYIDPAQGNYLNAPRGDLVLVTDIHGDHMNPDALAQARKPEAPVVMPAGVQKQAGERIPGPAEIIANGQTKTVAGVTIEAVPMYNLQRGPAPGQLYHDKGRGNGYILTLGGQRLYFAGDTECTPEMKALRNIDVAFIPMNLPYTMTPAEAAGCVAAFKPRIAIPYHFMGQKPEEFEVALKGSGVEVRMLKWYPAK
jgi:L-ascorbate metabolism protein UlaG (beta-lactamase superfamily)